MGYVKTANQYFKLLLSLRFAPQLPLPFGQYFPT